MFASQVGKKTSDQKAGPTRLQAIPVDTETKICLVSGCRMKAVCLVVLSCLVLGLEFLRQGLTVAQVELKLAM